MGEERIEQHVFRYIEKELYNYPVNKKLIENWKIESQGIVDESKTTLSFDSDRFPQNKITNSTLAKTMRLAALEQRVDRARWYCTAIEDVMETLGPEDRRLVELKYFQALLTNSGVARELNISRSEFYRRRAFLVEKFRLRIGLV